MDDETRMIKVLAKEVKSTYAKVDKRMAVIPNVCKKGCSHCCNQSVNVFLWEESIIIRKIRSFSDNEKSVIRENVECWFEVFNENTREATRENPLYLEEFMAFEHKFRMLRIPCPMLIDNQCSIYKERPLVCRTYLANDSPEKCFKDPNRKTVSKAEEWQTFFIMNPPRNDIPPEIRTHYKPIAYLIVDEVNARIKSKPFVPVRK